MFVFFSIDTPLLIRLIELILLVERYVEFIYVKVKFYKIFLSGLYNTSLCLPIRGWGYQRYVIQSNSESL